MSDVMTQLAMEANDKAVQIARLKDENDKLRERIHELEMEGSDHFYRTAYAEDANRTLEADNAKLRELVRDYEHCSMHADCSRCEYDGTTSTHCPLSPCFPDIDELSELGVDA